MVGKLERGCRVQVTDLHRVLPQVDTGKTPVPVIFIEYKGQECILKLGDANWLVPLEDVPAAADRIPVSLPV